MTPQEQLIQDFREVFGGSAGARVLGHLRDLCFFNRSVVGRTVQETYFNEGSRYIYLHILRTLALTEEAEEQLVKQQHHEITKGDYGRYRHDPIAGSWSAAIWEGDSDRDED